MNNNQQTSFHNLVDEDSHNKAANYELASYPPPHQPDSAGNSSNLEITAQKLNTDPTNSHRFSSTHLDNTSSSHMKATLLADNDGDVYLYKLWPGKNRFYFKGRLMTGPKKDIIENLTMWAFLIGISALYFVVTIPYLWEHVTVILPIACITLFLSTAFFLAKTSFTDPGIIPRKKIWELNGEVPEAYNAGEDEEQADNNDIDLENRPNKRICKTCNIIRPPRSTHCNDCGNCVSVFDHHCPFVNNCIGKRNYKYFIGFIFSLSMLGVSYITGFIFYVVGSIQFGEGIDDGISKIVQSTPITVLIIVILGLPTLALVIVMTGFFCFHLVLVLKGSTTKEQLKGIYVSQADLKNNANNWFRQDPVLFNPRQRISEEQLNKFYEEDKEKVINV